ncbi:MAG: sigma-70 family RNA polymerase sigma factor [Planctomycetales bacterium]|nr:sigma-70 family RNA polymerase sigma factor [Planctomycetales bacterium]
MQDQVPNLDPSNWVSVHGETLYAYAMSRLKNADAAEDAVQEALLGGLKNLSHFPPESDVGPWLMGILKKKVVDRQRKSAREDTATGDVDPILATLFDKNGHWTEAARAADPLRLDSLEQSEFMGILKRCLKGLPPNQAAVFVGRELNERNPEDLCKELGVSSTNLWVLMYRARLRLAECIRARWAMGEA